MLVGTVVAALALAFTSRPVRGVAAVPAADHDLNQIACRSTTDCFAIGTTFVWNPESFSAFIEHWNGSRWTAQASPQPAHGDWILLSGIACPSRTTCFAVGETRHGQTWGPLLEVLQNGTWQVAPSAFPAGTGIGGVTCTGASSCVAVGGRAGGAGAATFVSRWDGHVWKTIPSPNTPDPWNYLGDVECRSASDCTAVGHTYSDGRYYESPLIEHWDGMHWAIQPAPQPSGTHLAALTGVACATASTCFAAGVHDGQYLTEKWDGHAWSLDAPQAGAKVAYVTDVACPTATECIAVGVGYAQRSATGYIERWDGTSWASQFRPPPPTGQPATGFSGVACPAANMCLAVGHTGPNDAPSVPWSVRYDGNKWSAVPTATT